MSDSGQHRGTRRRGIANRGTHPDSRLPSAVQASAPTELPDYSQEVTFNQTASFNDFDQEVQTWFRWKIRRHRARRFVPRFWLRNVWNEIPHDQPIRILIVLKSNGWSYQDLYLAYENHELDRPIPQRSPDPPSGGQPRQVPVEPIVPHVRREVLERTTRIVAERVAREVLDQTVQRIGLTLLGSVISALLLVSEIYNRLSLLYEAVPAVQVRITQASGLCMAVTAIALAQDAWRDIGRGGVVFVAGEDYIRALKSSDSANSRRLGELIEEGWEEVRDNYHSIRRAIGEAMANSTEDPKGYEQFDSLGDLTDYIIQALPGGAVVEMWARRYTQTYQSSNNFFWHSRRIGTR